MPNRSDGHLNLKIKISFSRVSLVQLQPSLGHLCFLISIIPTPPISQLIQIFYFSVHLCFSHQRFPLLIETKKAFSLLSTNISISAKVLYSNSGHVRSTNIIQEHKSQTVTVSLFKSHPKVSSKEYDLVILYVQLTVFPVVPITCIALYSIGFETAWPGVSCW